MESVQTTGQILDINKWSNTFAENNDRYLKGDPYPHISFENFLEPWAAEKATSAFPEVKDSGWIHYMHVNEKKHGLNKFDLIPDFLQEVIKTLNSEQFVTALSQLTGIPGLKPDPSLEGGGLHQSQRGGFLNIHADFTVHPHKRNWRRRVNVLVYLNPEWLPEYRGDLELWSRDMKACVQKISPVHNRCVIFNTDEDSYHGLPDPIMCPEDMTRKSIALYYFTEEENVPRKKATNYRARPDDGLKSILIYLDKQLISLYNTLKGWLGINDDFISKVLNFFNRRKKQISPLFMQESRKYSLIFALLGAFFFIPFLGGVHLFDWDEVNFAEISREMLLTRDYLRVYINFEPFWEKPPLFFWLQASAMSIFGVGEFAARLPNALCGVISLVLLYQMGRKLYNHTFGVIWALVYLGTILPFLYFKSGIIDPIFNLFIFLGLYFFILFYWKKDRFEGIELKYNYWYYLFLGGFFVGLGILTKGQVAYLITCLTLFVYWVYQRFRFYVNVPQFLFFTFAATLVTLFWYGLETMKNGTWFIEEFNRYQYRLFSTPDAGHRGFLGYHFVVLLVGCFPASIFLMRSFFKLPEPEFAYQLDFRRWMKFLFWVVLILFSIVKSKIVHYSSMCYFPLTFLAALTLYHVVEKKIIVNRWMKIGLASIGGLYVFAVVALPFIGRNIDVLKPLFNDPFAVANMDADVNWTGFEVIPGLVLLGVLIWSIRLFNRQQNLSAVRTLFGGTAVFVMLTLIFLIGRIESYSQRAAIEFYESKQGEDCYIITSGFKSYAHLFYFRKQPENKEPNSSKQWFLTGPIDKDVYVVTKIHKTRELEEIPDLKEINRKNGFVFYKREAN